MVVRKAYGAGYYVMNGRAYEPDQIYAWPSAEIWVPSLITRPADARWR